MTKKLTTEEFIERAKAVHGDKYDYSKVKYQNSKQKVLIICQLHGAFEQNPNHHAIGKGCSKCGLLKTTSKLKLTTEQFIEKAKAVHGDKYDYSKVEYVNALTKVEIICQLHGNFYQKPNDHFNNHGCRLCGAESSSVNRKLTTNDFIKKSLKVHGDMYDYSKVKYIKNTTKVEIICTKHGAYYQTPANHLEGNGCVLCGNDSMRVKRKDTTEQFIEKAKAVHGDKYDYSKVEYVNSRTGVKIGCDVHGDFEQIPNGHLQGHGCKSCSHSESNEEKQVSDFIKSLGLDVIENDRIIIKPYELDIVIPSKKIAIEYCGLYWHSELYKDKNYHKNKMDMCNEAGYRLITIFSDEWSTNKELIKKKLKHTLGVSTELKTSARECTLETNCDVKSFLNKNHIQGSVAYSFNYALKLSGEIVAVMTFKKSGDVVELTRYATSCIVRGGFSKLLKAFTNDHPNQRVKSFADLRWSDGKLYESNSWIMDTIIPPDYHYVIKTERYHKFGFRHKGMKTKLEHYDPKISEHQNMMNNGIYRIYDCGKIRYIL